MIGSDIELFLDKPARDFGIPEEFIDGLCLEIPTKPVETLQQIKEEVDAYIDIFEIREHLIPDFVIPNIFEKYGKNIPKKDLEMGCQPEFGLDGMVIEKRKRIPMRSAGGHIHIDYNRDNLELVEALDCSILLVDYLIDTEKKALRMTNYGRPGAHRPKNYGVEYRSLSNQWYFNDNIRQSIDKLLPKVIANPDETLYLARRQNIREEVYIKNNYALGRKFLYVVQNL